MSPSDHHTYITIGKVGATHGIKGWLRIHSYSEETQQITKYDPWYLSDTKENWIPAKVEATQMHSGNLLVKLAGLETPEAARLYTGKIIAIRRSQMPELKEGEYYWSDLIGLTVRHQSGEIMGTVAYLIATGSNDALVVSNENKEEFAIPFLLDRTILAIDLSKKEILVDWERI